jgi:hypothetical protein
MATKTVVGIKEGTKGFDGNPKRYIRNATREGTGVIWSDAEHAGNFVDKGSAQNWLNGIKRPEVDGVPKEHLEVSEIKV